MHTRRTRGESNRSVKRAAELAESAARWWSLLGRRLVPAADGEGSENFGSSRELPPFALAELGAPEDPLSIQT